MDGKPLVGSDVKLSCKSSDGSDPISYKWDRVLDKGKSLGKLPNLALIGKKNSPLKKKGKIVLHYTDMLIHHSSPLQRNAVRIHFYISGLFMSFWKGFAEHTTFPPLPFSSLPSYICKHWHLNLPSSTASSQC